MRWLVLLWTSMVLGACGGSSGAQPTPFILLPPRDQAPTDRVDPTPTAAPPIAPTSMPGFRADLPDLGEAPELNNAIWLNTDRPVRLADIHGKVVLIDMWTFG